MTCNPEGDPRSQHDVLSFIHPEKFCQHAPREETEVLFTKYMKNVSSLAEALCNDHDDDDDDDQLSNSVQADIHKIGHAQFSLADWLGKFDWKKNIPRIVPVVLEKGFDFNQQIDDALYFLNNVTGMESPSQFAHRRDLVHQKDIIDSSNNKNNKNKNTTTTINNDENRHSSVLHNKQQIIPLSKLG